MFKQIIFLLISTFLGIRLLAQNSTERYCEVSVYAGRHLKGLAIDSGAVQNDHSGNDSLELKAISDIQENKSIVDLFNYMSNLFWTYN